MHSRLSIYFKYLLACYFVLTLSAVYHLSDIRSHVYKTVKNHQGSAPALSLSNVRPIDGMLHSRTLNVADAIYVISLARRTDRRATMDDIAHALDLDFTYINATDYSDPASNALIEHIIDRVRWQRPRLDDGEIPPDFIPQTPKHDPGSEWGVNVFPFKWSEEVLKYEKDPLAVPLGMGGSDYWEMEDPPKEWLITHRMPELSEEEKMSNIPKAAGGINDLHDWFEITKPSVSCWHGHIRALREIVANQHKAGIIFEDDIDIEWDLERLLVTQKAFLPSGWDMVYLGHCWSQEYVSQIIPGAPMLRPAFNPLCTHAYMVSLSGATKLLRYLRSPDFAYGRHIDQAYLNLYADHRLEVFSFYPPVAIQSKKDVSDITGEIDMNWSGHEQLIDSVLERIALYRNRTKGLH